MFPCLAQPAFLYRQHYSATPPGVKRVAGKDTVRHCAGTCVLFDSFWDSCKKDSKNTNIIIMYRTLEADTGI
jgi:hypothetical protein